MSARRDKAEKVDNVVNFEKDYRSKSCDAGGDGSGIPGSTLTLISLYWTGTASHGVMAGSSSSVRSMTSLLLMLLLLLLLLLLLRLLLLPMLLSRSVVPLRCASASEARIATCMRSSSLKSSSCRVADLKLLLLLTLLLLLLLMLLLLLLAPCSR